MGRTVAIYARVSTEHEAQLSALDNQVQYYDNILLMHPDWTLYKRYIDEGITGTSVKKRKNFLNMIEDAKAGKFDLIVTREVSRFARNTVDTLQETRKLKKMGVEVYFTEDNIWTFNDEDGELRLTIMATLAQNESKKTSIRVKAGQKISFENGVFYGNGNIMGYDKVGKDMIVNEKQAEIVKYIYISYLNGKGVTEIKYDLEKQGIPTATGKKTWAQSTIVRMLQNKFYYGDIEYRKYFVEDFLEQKAKKNIGQVEKIVVQGRHEPIISKEDYDKVQEILDSRAVKLNLRRVKGSAKTTWLWSSKLVCECGSKMNRNIYHKYEDYNTYFYICRHQKVTGSKKVRIKKGLSMDGLCETPSVQEWKLDLMAGVIFDVIWNQKKDIINVANQLIEDIIKNTDYDGITDEEISECERKIDYNSNKLEKLLDLYLNAGIPKDKYFEKKKELEDNIANLEEKKKELKLNHGVSKDTLECKIESLKQILLEKLDYKSGKLDDDLINLFVEKVVVYKDKFVWKLNYLKSFKSSDDDVYLASIIINKDQIMNFKQTNDKYKHIKSFNDILVDIYI